MPNGIKCSKCSKEFKNGESLVVGSDGPRHIEHDRRDTIAEILDNLAHLPGTVRDNFAVQIEALRNKYTQGTEGRC